MERAASQPQAAGVGAGAARQSPLGVRPVLRDQTVVKPVLRRACACGGRCDDCGGGAKAPPLVHDVLRSSGQPLDADVRATMESRFGYDFSAVRVHADAQAASSAEAVQARAYTVGRHVVFGAGRYAPSSDSGQRLLAHELAHVRQQASANPAGGALEIGHADDPHEHAADAAAHSPMATQSPAPLGVQRVQRAPQKRCSSLGPDAVSNQLSSAFGTFVAHPVIEADYTANMKCNEKTVVYDTSNAGQVDKAFVAFLVAHNPTAVAATFSGVKRPDIVLDRPPSREFEEIKADSPAGLSSGFRKLAALGYLTALGYQPGTTYTPTPEIPLTLPLAIVGAPQLSLEVRRAASALVGYKLCITADWDLISWALFLMALGRFVKFMKENGWQGGPKQVPVPLGKQGESFAFAPDGDFRPGTFGAPLGVPGVIAEPCPTVDGRLLLYWGCRADAVQNARDLINQWNAQPEHARPLLKPAGDPKIVDGPMVEAIKMIQRFEKLSPVDGRMGVNTWTKLEKVTAKPAPSSATGADFSQITTLQDMIERPNDATHEWLKGDQRSHPLYIDNGQVYYDPLSTRFTVEWPDRAFVDLDITQLERELAPQPGMRGVITTVTLDAYYRNPANGRIYPKDFSRRLLPRLSHVVDVIRSGNLPALQTAKDMLQLGLLMGRGGVRMRSGVPGGAGAPAPNPLPAPGGQLIPILH